MNKLKLLLLASVLFTGSCGEASPSSPSSGSANSASTYRSESAAATLPNSSKQSAANSQPQDVSLDKAAESRETAPTERKIIRNAELTLEAASPEEALRKITSIAEGKGGFVIDSQQSSSSAQATVTDRVTVGLRVPADKFNEALEEIRKISSRVVVENVKGQDVTEEFIDVEARLKAKKALEGQFLEIMKQGKTVEDALNVQKELADVRGEIEQIEGRKRFLENQTSFSTIRITLETPTAFSANSSGFFYQAGRSFSSGFTFALNFILGFITFIIAITPFLVLIVLPLYLLARYLWRKHKKRVLAAKLAQEEKQEEKTEQT